MCFSPDQSLLTEIAGLSSKVESEKLDGITTLDLAAVFQHEMLQGLTGKLSHNLFTLKLLDHAGKCKAVSSVLILFDV